MFDLLDDKLIFKDSDSQIYEIGLVVNDLENLNKVLNFILNQLVISKYYYDFICNLITINNIFKDLEVSINFQLFNKYDDKLISINDLIKDFNFFQVDSIRFQVKSFISKPKELYLNLVLNSCKI